MILTPADRAVRPGTDEAGSLELWILSGQAALMVLMWSSYGITQLSPKIALVLSFGLTGIMVLLGPRGRMGRIVLLAPLIAFLWWWGMSVMWTSTVYGWEDRTLTSIPPVIVAVVVGSMLPRRHLGRLLVFFFAGVSLYQIVPMTLSYSTASINADPIGGTILHGWRGSFVHKNSMAMFLAASVLVMVTLGRPGWFRRIVVAQSVLFLVMSRSATGMSALLTVVVGVLWLRSYRRFRGQLSTAFVLGSIALVVAVITVSTVLITWFTEIYGKDLTFSGRTKIWALVFDTAMQKPWFGWGVGGVFVEFERDPTRSIQRGAGFFFAHSHNGFLELFLLLGVVGLTLWMVLVVSTVRAGIASQSIDEGWSGLAIMLPIMLLVINVSEVVSVGGWLTVLVLIRVGTARMLLDERSRPELMSWPEDADGPPDEPDEPAEALEAVDGSHTFRPGAHARESS